jgi:NADH-quinone oxidoreductase subunit C
MTSAGEPGAWDAWAVDVARHVEAGFDHLDLLTAIDRPRSDQIEVVIHLQRRHESGAVEDAWGRTLLDRDAPLLDSVTSVLPAAAWHEREIAEMFGVEIRGHPDPSPLLLHSIDGPPPLRKDTPLLARIETPWPGAEEAGRRRASVPGVPREWLEQR